MAILTTPSLCFGTVLHQRLRPLRHRFVYDVCVLTVPLSCLAALGNGLLRRNRVGLMSFHDRDYGPRDGSGLEAWIRARLGAAGITAADGEIVLQAMPRVLGYLFNPIVFWYCHDRAGALRAVVCEVNNTFGERHNYLVAHADQRPLAPTDWLAARKVFHVSPFCEVTGHYHFRFRVEDQRLSAQIDYHDGAGAGSKLLLTSIQVRAAPATARRTAAALLRHPLLTLGVVWRIHWQALLLWTRRVPVITKPLPPLEETTR